MPIIYLLICLKTFISSDQFTHQKLKQPKFSNPCRTYSIGVELTQSCQSNFKEYSTPNLDPAYHINSTKAWLTVSLYYCNYSNYDVRSGRYSALINARGYKGVGLEAVGCNFINNKMTVLNTGVFYFTEGPHEVTITNCTFISNQGADASIVGGTVFTLDMQDCYIKNNIANSRFGQINLAGRLSGTQKPTFNCQNVIFYNNRIWPTMGQQTIALLTNFTTVTFTSCSFTVQYCESTSMVGLKGKDTSITFTDCCFYINYTYYPFSYYHVKFETSATGSLQFRGTNSFSGTQSKAYNKIPKRSDKMVFNINKCIDDSPCQPGQYLFNNQCYSQCPSGTYNEGQNCFECSEGCQDCISYEDCILCEQGYYYKDSKCYNQDSLMSSAEVSSDNSLNDFSSIDNTVIESDLRQTNIQTTIDDKSLFDSQIESTLNDNSIADSLHSDNASPESTANENSNIDSSIQSNTNVNSNVDFTVNQNAPIESNADVNSISEVKIDNDLSSTLDSMTDNDNDANENIHNTNSKSSTKKALTIAGLAIFGVAAIAYIVIGTICLCKRYKTVPIIAEYESSADQAWPTAGIDIESSSNSLDEYYNNVTIPV